MTIWEENFKKAEIGSYGNYVVKRYEHGKFVELYNAQVKDYKGSTDFLLHSSCYKDYLKNSTLSDDQKKYCDLVNKKDTEFEIFYRSIYYNGEHLIMKFHGDEELDTECYISHLMYKVLDVDQKYIFTWLGKLENPIIVRDTISGMFWKS